MHKKALVCTQLDALTSLLCTRAVVRMQLDLNEYADLTWEEFSSTRLGFNSTQYKSRYVTLAPANCFRQLDVCSAAVLSKSAVAV